MSPVVQVDIIVSDGDHEIDVAEHEARLVRHIIRSDPEVSSNVHSVAQDKSIDDVSQRLRQRRQGDRFMSDIEVSHQDSPSTDGQERHLCTSAP